MTVNCPHCGKPIDLVGAKDLKEDYGIGPNSVIHARERGDFPEPWLRLGNRNLYLRVQVDEYVAQRKGAELSNLPPNLLIREIESALKALPAKERREVVERLKG